MLKFMFSFSQRFTSPFFRSGQDFFLRSPESFTLRLAHGHFCSLTCFLFEESESQKEINPTILLVCSDVGRCSGRSDLSILSTKMVHFGV